MDTSDFLCPISREIMSDPVIATDGHTYERQMIAEWLRIKRTSPLTNERMDSNVLLPNHTLKKVIDAWLESQNNESPQDVRPVTPRGNGYDSPHLVEVRGDELEAIKQSVYSAYDSNDEVMLIRDVARVRNDALTGACSDPTTT